MASLDRSRPRHTTAIVTDGSRARYRVQAVADAFAVLEALAPSSPVGVSEIARRTGLQKNKAFRLLATLEELGYVQQVQADGDYRLAPGCLSIARAYLSGDPLLEAAAPVTRALSSLLHETVFLAVRSSDHAVTVAGTAADRSVAYRLEIGALLPLTRSAAGIVLLSNEQTPVPSGQDPVALSGLLEGVRRNGYFVDSGMYDPGCVCLAAPVKDGPGGVKAALCVAGPSERMPAAAIEATLIPSLLEAASTLNLPPAGRSL